MTTVGIKCLAIFPVQANKNRVSPISKILFYAIQQSSLSNHVFVNPKIEEDSFVLFLLKFLLYENYAFLVGRKAKFLNMYSYKGTNSSLR